MPGLTASRFRNIKMPSQGGVQVPTGGDAAASRSNVGMKAVRRSTAFFTPSRCGDARRQPASAFCKGQQIRCESGADGNSPDGREDRKQIG